MFGKEKEQVVEDPTSGQSNDLGLAFGDEVGQVGEDSSLTDSIPPPPPIIDAKNEEDSRTLEESPSTGPDNDAEDSLDEKEEAESIKRKKLILICACIVSFFVLLGLAIKYGTTRNQPKTTASSAAGSENGSFDSPLTETETETSAESPTVPNPPTTAEDNAVEQNATQEITNSSNTTAIDVTEEEPTIPGEIDQGSPSATINPSSTGTSSGTLPEIQGMEECVRDEISIFSTCNDNGVAAVSMRFCLLDGVSDQFWEFVSTPPRIPPIIANDWGWIRDTAVADFAFLPEGTYEVGIFADGDQQLDEYPLVTFTQFDVSCGL